MESKIQKISLPWLWPAARPCGAKTRSGQPCKKWGMANGKCRLHGGLTKAGQKTQTGLMNSRMSRFKHGKYTLEKQKQRTIERLSKLFPAFGVERITARINPMSFIKFQEFRSKLQSYILKKKT